MTTRTAKLMGSAYTTSGDATITVDYNGSRVFSGPVPTILVDVLPNNQPNADSNWAQELAQFNFDAALTGNIPVSISVTNGILFFSNFKMNYIGPVFNVTPTTPGIAPNRDDPSTYSLTVDISTELHFGDANTNTTESDGILNTKLNGQSWLWRPVVSEDLLGDWAYPVSSGNVFAFDLFVDPNKLRLTNDPLI